MSTRRRAALALAGALAAAVVGLLSCSDDGEGTAATTTTTAVPTSAEPTRIDDVQDLGEAIGCDEVVIDEYSFVPIAADPHLCNEGDEAIALLHVAPDDAQHDRLVAYLRTSSTPVSELVGLPNGCPGETDDQTRARIELHVVVGDRWVATTGDAEVADRIATAADGEIAPIGPDAAPPASYLPPPTWDCTTPP